MGIGFENLFKRPKLVAAGLGAVAGLAGLLILSNAKAELPLQPPENVDNLVSGQIVAMMSM